MKSLEEIVARLVAMKPSLTDRFGVRKMAVFGSYARGEQREDSDVDILVEVDPSIGLRFVDLADEIERSLGIRTEVVSHRALKDKHWDAIEKELVYVP